MVARATGCALEDCNEIGIRADWRPSLAEEKEVRRVRCSSRHAGFLIEERTARRREKLSPDGVSMIPYAASRG